MIPASTRYIPVFILLFLLVSCAGLHPGMEEPEVSIINIQPLESHNMEASLLVSLRVINPNDFPLNITGLSCRLDIDDHHFATGVGNEKQIIPAFGTDILSVQVYASVIDMVGSVIGIIGDTQRNPNRLPLNYSITGKIRLGGTGLPSTINFTSQGELNVNKH